MKKIFTLILLVVCGYSYSQTFILPSSGVQSTYSGGCPVGTCSGTLLDPGGNSNYPNNVNQIYQTFCPTTPGTCLQVTFTAFNTENNFDYLTIGNGPAQNSAVFTGAPANASGQIMGTPAVPFSYTANNSSGCLTFRFNSDFITNRPGFTASLSCVACGSALPAGNSDACAASFICSNLGFNDLSNGPGINPTEGCGGTNCVTGENYSNWYSFSAATSGSLTFTINPNTATNDFDYALFGPNVACGSLGAPLRCSYAANTGNTGLGNGAVDVSEDVAGDGWTSGINVTAGQTYMLMVNNWTAGGTGFNILFGGTATLGVLAPAVSSTSICLGQTAVLTATPATSGGTYTWTPGGANTQTISVSPGSTTSYSVVYAQGGCTSPASALATVTVNSVPTANAGSSTTLTCAAPNATLSGSGGGTYAWTGPSITSGSNTANPVVNAPGTYSLAVTSTAGCTSTLATVAISQNTTVPSPTASNSATLSCTTTTVALTGGPSSGVTYQWSGPGFSGGTTSQNAIATAPGTYTLKVTDAVNGCTATAVTTVSQNTLAPAVTSAASGSLTCSALTVNASATTTTTPVSYNWSGTGITSGSGTGTITVNQPGTFSYTVTNTSNGCSTTGSQTVVQNTVAPSVTAATSGTLTCSALTVNASATTSTTPVSYNWSGTGITSGSGTGTITVNQPGTFNYTVTNTSNGCTTSGSQSVIQNTVAPSVTGATTGTLTCSVLTVNASATTSTTPVSYNWSGTGITSGSGTGTITVNQPGTFNYTVTNTSNGCTTSGSQVVTQSVAFPSVTGATSGTLTCSISTVNASATTTTTPVSYNWIGIGITSGSGTGTITVNQPGTFNYTVTNTSNGCVTTGSQSVTQNTVAPSVAAATTGSLTCTALTVNASATTTTTPVSYNWSGTGITSGSGTGTVTVNQPGTFNYTVTNTSNGCSTTGSQSVVQNTTTPSVSMPTTQTITCASPTVSLVGSATPSTSNPVWTGGACAGANTYTASACSPGNYTLTVTNPVNGCVNSGTVDVVPSSGIPVVSASTNGSITCLTSSAEVSATTSMSDVTYSWSGPGAVSGASSSTGTVTVGGTYQCVVTNSLTGCASTITTVVNTNTIVPTSSITVGGVLTCSVTSVSLGCNLAGMNYTWTPVGANTQSTSINVPGPCTLTVFDPSNGCTFSTTATVTQNTVTPTGLSAGTDQTLTCTSTSVTLNGSITTPTNASVVWTGAGVCGTSTSLSSAACAAGVYTLTATDVSNGCSSTSTVEVFANAGAPTATISSTALVLDCNNATQSVTVTSTPNTGVTYSWNTPPASVSANGDVATFNTPNTYICSVTNTLSNCSTPVQVAVTTDTSAPVVTISGTQTLTCANPTATISATSTPSSGVTYLWSGTLVSGQGTNIVTVNQAGNYDVIVTNAANGCTATVSSQVIPDTNVPVASITASSSNSVITCQNTSVTLTTNVVPSGSYQYTWSSGAGSSSSASVTSASVYTVIVINSVSGCSTTAQYTVTGNTVPPTVTANNTVMPCGSPSVTLGTTTTATNVGYSWSSSGSGSIISGANTSSPIAGGPGQYVVTVTDNDNGCSNTSTVTVTSIAITAAFTADPTSGTAPLLVNFTNQSSGSGNIYSWNFGDDNNNTSSSTNPAHTYNTTGTYVVTLVVTDPSGLCSSTSTVTIDVFENSSIVVPNVFTPNGDGKNDVFKITTTGIKDLNCDIFNRWGTKVANISGVNGTWDGSNVNDGTFFFILTATGFDGQEYKQQGYINLFR